MTSHKMSVVLLFAAIAGCDAKPDLPPVSTATAETPASSVPTFRIEVVRKMPHDPTAYTQGLVFHDGHLYESTGKYGESTVRELDPQTGAVLHSTKLAANVFGEGLAVVDDALVQISWKEMTAYKYNFALQKTGSFTYQGDGWGLCDDGQSIYMTSGDDKLIKRDRKTFAPVSSQTIMQDGAPLSDVNELECVGDFVYGNVYYTANIVKIEKSSGRVVAHADGAALLQESGVPKDGDHVMNGIANNAATQTFWVTGKYWPVMYEVRFAEK